VLMLFVILRFDLVYFFFFSSRRRHTRSKRDWSSDVCSSDLRLVVRSIPRLGRGVSCGWIRCDPAPVFTVDPPAGGTIADAGHSCRFGLPVVRCPDSLPSGGPSSGRVRTARPDTPSHPGRAAVEKSTRAYSPVDRSSPEEPAARILGDRRAHAILWAEVRCAQPRSDARISAPGRAVLRA